MTMRRTGPALLLSLLALALAAPASAAPLSGVLATDASDGPIAAYSTTAAWSRWDDAAAVYRIVVDRGGTIRTLNVPPSQRPFDLAAGRGPDGATWLLWSRCPGTPLDTVTDCDIEGYDFGTRKPKTFPFAARPGVIERAPAIHGDRLVWVSRANTDLVSVHEAAPDGSGDRLLAVLPPSTCNLSLTAECFTVTRATAISSAVRGDRVAVTSRVSTAGGDFGLCGLATVRLLDVRTSVVRTLDDAVCGLSGQGMSDVAFDADGRLWWRQSCGGDPSACQGTRGGPFRQTAAGTQRLQNDLGSRLSGTAVASRTPILLARAPWTTPGCTAGPLMSAYRCGIVTAIAKPSYVDLPPQRENLPPPGYVTVRGTSRVRLLRPPATMGCSRGDTIPRAGATLWAGASWVDGQRRTSGPAVPVTATSGGRTVRGTVPKGRTGSEGQRTTTLDLGGTSRACDRTWTLTYRPPNAKPIRFRTRVLGR